MEQYESNEMSKHIVILQVTLKQRNCNQEDFHGYSKVG